MERDADPVRGRRVTPVRRTRVLAILALVAATLLLAACGATAEDPQNDPAATTPATFGEATFDASTWR